jgi:hypothetical protein
MQKTFSIPLQVWWPTDQRFWIVGRRLSGQNLLSSRPKCRGSNFRGRVYGEIILFGGIWHLQFNCQWTNHSAHEIMRFEIELASFFSIDIDHNGLNSGSGVTELRRDSLSLLVWSSGFLTVNLFSRNPTFLDCPERSGCCTIGEKQSHRASHKTKFLFQIDHLGFPRIRRNH